MKDDPREISSHLIHEHGLEEARAIALSALLQAQQDRDNYALSVWREVKRFLAKPADPENETAA